MHVRGQIRNKLAVRYKWSVRWSIYNAYKNRWTGGYCYLTEKILSQARFARPIPSRGAERSSRERLDEQSDTTPSGITIATQN